MKPDPAKFCSSCEDVIPSDSFALLCNINQVKFTSDITFASCLGSSFDCITVKIFIHSPFI